MLKNTKYQFHLRLLLVMGLAVAAYSFSRLVSNFSRSAPKKKDFSSISQIQPHLDRSARSQSNFAAGTYLYGQSNLPEQIGKAYLVFKVEQNKVFGALYYPQSEFYCFCGKLTSQQMNINVIDIDPYQRTTAHPYSINLESSFPLATTGNGGVRELALKGYQQIEDISDNDRRILNTCLKSKDLN